VAESEAVRDIIDTEVSIDRGEDGDDDGVNMRQTDHQLKMR